jgi:uncharacterized membrane protein
MSSLVVITFDNMEEAGKVREALHELEKQNLLKMDDAAIIVKDEQGKVQVKNQTDRGVKVGAVGGSLLGLLFLGPFALVAGVALGALAGAGVGSMLDKGVPKDFAKEVSDSLTPGTSALFVLVAGADPNSVRGALEPFHGHLYHTNLDTEAEETLRRVLKDRPEEA